jgi:DNA-binding NarL/FixJ family response regulator
LKAGASGFLLKDAPRDQLVGAVRTVAAAARCLRQHSCDALSRISSVPCTGAGSPAELSDLTERELEVLTLVVAGACERRIATRLFVSEATVRTHVTHTLAKLGLRDRVQGDRLAYESGVVGAREPGECGPPIETFRGFIPAASIFPTVATSRGGARLW